MAKEAMKKQIPPDFEVEYINIYGAFGWSVKDSREVFNRSSHLEASGDDINSVITTTHYITLIFERDTTMKNYSKLASLQKKLDAVFDPDPRLVVPVTFGKFFLILIGVFAFVGIISLGDFLFGGLVCLTIAGLIGFWRFKKITEWQSFVNNRISERDKIVAQARNI